MISSQAIFLLCPVLLMIFSLTSKIAHSAVRKIPSIISDRFDHSIKQGVMNTDTLTNPVVKKAVEALQKGDANEWFALFNDKAELFDDGNKVDFRKFFKKALGHEHFSSLDNVENKGLDLYGKFHGDTRGKFQTYFKFYIDPAGRICRMDIGQPNY